MACDFISIAMAIGMFAPSMFWVTFAVFRTSIAMVRNDLLYYHLKCDGWAKEPMQKGVELRGNMAIAANDDFEEDG